YNELLVRSSSLLSPNNTNNKGKIYHLLNHYLSNLDKTYNLLLLLGNRIPYDKYECRLYKFLLNYQRLHKVIDEYLILRILFAVCPSPDNDASVHFPH